VKSMTPAKSSGPSSAGGTPAGRARTPGYHPSQIFEGQQQRQFATSAVRGSADTLCSARVFPGLTHFGHGSTILRYAIVILSRKALACSSASSLVSIPPLFVRDVQISKLPFRSSTFNLN